MDKAEQYRNSAEFKRNFLPLEKVGTKGIRINNPDSIFHNREVVTLPNHLPEEVSEVYTRLFAAAPDLLDACEYVSRLHPKDSILADVLRVRDAIKKAKGE